MATHLTSTYETKLEDAEKLLEQIAHLRITILRAEAKREAQIARAKSACAEETEADRETLGALEQRLTTFITTHQDQFTSPRMHRTPFGRFGLQGSTRCIITDEAAVIACAKANGYTDLVQVTETIVRKRLSARLGNGEAIPGAHLHQGVFTKYDIDKSVLENIE